MAPDDDSIDDIPIPKHVPTSQVEAEIPKGPESGELSEHWYDLKEALNLPHLSDDQLREFVNDFVSNRIFTSAHLRDNEVGMLPMIFMPLALGCMSKVQPDSLSQIGCIWEHMHKAAPRSINGKPIFFSLNLLHKDDWERAMVAIEREQERRKNIPL